MCSRQFFCGEMLICSRFAMFISMRVVFILWSTKLLNSNAVSDDNIHGNLSIHTNRPANLEPMLDCNFEKCVQKCCPEKHIFSAIQRLCIPQPEELSLAWTTDYPKFDILPNCRCQKLKTNTVIIDEGDFQLNLDGSLHQHSCNLDYNRSIFCFEFILEDATYLPSVYFDERLCKAADDAWKFVYYTYGLGLSNLFLVTTLVLYISTPALHQSVQNKSFSCYVISLILGFSSLMAVQNINKLDAFCTISAYAAQFWLLAQFFWLNVMCIDIRYAVNTTTLNVQTSKRKFLFYCLYAWGCPLSVSVATVLSENLSKAEFGKPNIGKDRCWFQPYNGPCIQDPRFLYFYAPISVTIIINMGIFFDTAIMLWYKNREWEQNHHNRRRHKQQQKRLIFHLKLFIVMGLYWILEVASYFTNPDSASKVWFVLNVINSLQGVFIFLIFVCNRKVMFLLEKQFFPRRTFSRQYKAYLISNRNLNNSSRQLRTPRLSCSLRESYIVDTTSGKPNSEMMNFVDII